jgi:hypothetical protein
MSAPIINAAEAIKDALNSGTYSRSFTAVREYVLYKRLTQITDLTVIVQPLEDNMTIASREKDEHIFTISITVMEKCLTTAKVDELVSLAEEIYMSLRRDQLAGLDDYNVVSFENPTLYNPDELGSANLFVCELQVLVKVIY